MGVVRVGRGLGQQGDDPGRLPRGGPVGVHLDAAGLAGVERDRAVLDVPFEGTTFKKGTVESQSVRLAAGIVDRPGQRPKQ
ncbi:hypothetical protein ACGFNU_32895 [Spirillospora sp. NPDC048911]|uniref:hypothetical protein n=1 Tax=Spirillospora sp. NPDC048911 TaxID=3364527 RepID=UPI0037154075